MALQPRQGFVWCGSVGERAPENVRVRAHVNVCEWPELVLQTVHTRAYKSFEPLSLNTQEAARATCLSYHQVNIAHTF